MMSKTLKTRVFLYYFFPKSERSIYDQVEVIIDHSVLTFEKHPLVGEMKLKMSQSGQFFIFSISALSPEGAFQMPVRF